MNELLMAHYMLKTNPDKRFRRWVLSCMIGNTYYHNFVTHLLEAAYQREVYRIIDNGGSVQAEPLNRIMRETLTKFWGGRGGAARGRRAHLDAPAPLLHGPVLLHLQRGAHGSHPDVQAHRERGRSRRGRLEEGPGSGRHQDASGAGKMAGVDISTDAPLLDTIETIGRLYRRDLPSDGRAGVTGIQK